MNLGLGFVPTLKYNPFRTRIDLYKLCRNIKRRKLFGDSPTAQQLFKKPSTFVPNIQDAAVTVFEGLVFKDIDCLEKTHMKVRYNLSKQQSLSMEALAADKSITIKPADKGGGLVVLDSTTYKQEITRQLNDENFYKKIDQDLTLTIQKQIRVVLSEGLALDYINKDLFDFLYVEFPQVPVFYILPKIHKPGFPPRGRPILVVQSSLLENISKYVDSLLQSFVLSTQTYIRDTTDLIKKSKALVFLKKRL